MAAATFTFDMLLTIAVMGGALALFALSRLRADVVGLMVMAVLVVIGLLSPAEALQGFANEATVTVALMLALAAGLRRTGAIDLLGRWVARLAGRSELRLLALMLAVVVPVSALINNTAAVAILVPIVMGLDRRGDVKASRILMPLSFAGQLGGTLTLIGTSTNLLVAGLAVQLGVRRFGIFDITLPALALVGVGLVYFFTVGRWLTPHREAARRPLDGKALRAYLAGVEVSDGSPLAGKSLRESRFAETYGLEVVELERGAQRRFGPDAHTVLEPGDVLLVSGTTADIAQLLQKETALRLLDAPPDLRVGEPGGPQLAELLVPARSAAVGRTLEQLHLRAAWGVVALALQRHGTPVHGRMARLPLVPGDVVLVAGREDRLEQLHESSDFAVVGAVSLRPLRTNKLRFAVPIMGLVVLAAALELVPILVAALLGLIAMFLTGCITPDEVYRELDWMVVVLLGSILSLGLAMQRTGTAELVARQLFTLVGGWGPVGALAALYLLTSLLTEAISNNAAAAVLTPVAVEMAQELAVSPLPLLVAVMFSASNSFLTPIGYQTNTFVYGAGGYRFGDFLRVGGPLSALLLVVAVLVIPVFFPF